VAQITAFVKNAVQQRQQAEEVTNIQQYIHTTIYSVYQQRYYILCVYRNRSERKRRGVDIGRARLPNRRRRRRRHINTLHAIAKANLHVIAVVAAARMCPKFCDIRLGFAFSDSVCCRSANSATGSESGSFSGSGSDSGERKTSFFFLFLHISTVLTFVSIFDSLLLVHPDWKPAAAPNGKTYYYHVQTKETTWQKPLAD
jgi:hypothetical protein